MDAKYLVERAREFGDYAQIVDCRVFSALGWVAQEARAFKACDGKNRERLNAALAALENAYKGSP